MNTQMPNAKHQRSSKTSTPEFICLAIEYSLVLGRWNLDVTNGTAPMLI